MEVNGKELERTSQGMLQAHATADLIRTPLAPDVKEPKQK